MLFIAIYRIDGVLTDQQFSADDWTDAFTQIKFYLPNRAQLIGIHDTAMVSIRRTDKGNYKLKVHPIT